MSLTEQTVWEKAKWLALGIHADHRYGKHPFMKHLTGVDEQVIKYSSLLPIDQVDNVRGGAYCHDMPEIGVLYSFIKKHTNTEVAELSLALCPEVGRNRQERYNDRYYARILSIPYADFLRIADRLSNVMYSSNISDNGKMKMYRKEHESFCNGLKRSENHPYREMFEQLDKLFSIYEQNLQDRKTYNRL